MVSKKQLLNGFNESVHGCASPGECTFHSFGMIVKPQQVCVAPFVPCISVQNFRSICNHTFRSGWKKNPGGVDCPGRTF